MSAELIPIALPGTNREVVATLIDSTPMVSLRHGCESLNVDYSGQLQKLKGKPWATMGLVSTVAEDGKNREMVMIDRRTFTMWLATIDTNRVSDETRPIIEEFQAEAADALDAYFNGTSPALDLPAPAAGAIAEANPRVGGDRLACVVEAVHAKATVLRAFRDLVDADHLEAEARRALAGALGEIAGIDPGDAPLRVRDYLQQRGMTSAAAEAMEPEFDAFLGNRGIESLPALPKSGAPRGTGLRSFTYTEADRSALDAIYLGAAIRSTCRRLCHSPVERFAMKTSTIPTTLVSAGAIETVNLTDTEYAELRDRIETVFLLATVAVRGASVLDGDETVLVEDRVRYGVAARIWSNLLRDIANLDR